MQVKSYLEMAAHFAALETRPDDRNFRLGAVGIRGDGVIVCARNSACREPTPDAHAEARLARKLGGGTVFVARILQNGQWGLARPCPPCLTRLKAKRVERIFYTIGPNEWGCLYV